MATAQRLTTTAEARGDDDDLSNGEGMLAAFWESWEVGHVCQLMRIENRVKKNCSRSTITPPQFLSMRQIGSRCLVWGYVRWLTRRIFL
uniref:Uncharacterized protein n=1 Tax=Oryza glumipatula TaxID=40148 RepID=A0A0D9YYI0_9ORYZ